MTGEKATGSIVRVPSGWSGGSFTFLLATLTLGAVGVLGSNPIANRCWNGAIFYSTPAVSGEAAIGYFGSGCAGTLGVVNQTPSSRPVIGQTMSLGLNRLPSSSAIMLLGWSRTNSLFGPLPLDLTALGAPGCRALVSADATFFVIGAANAANWNMTLPNWAGLLGLSFYTQAYVFDPALNTLGASMSDAAAALIGT